jgi:hypothetical protein
MTDEEEEAGLPRRCAARNDGEEGGRAIGPGRAEHEDICAFCGSAVAQERVRIRPNKHRVLQAVRTGERKLFGKRRKDVFLQWFALTANVGFSAKQAGVCRQTVSKHRLSDTEFEASYRQAIALALPDLQARLFAYLKGRPKLNIHGEFEPPDDEDFDPQLALQILREQQRMMAAQERAPGRALKKGRMPRVATNEEVEAALTKALKALAARKKAAGQ